MADYRIKDLYNSEQYSEGADYASSPEIRENFNEWDYMYYANCLYKLKRYEEFLDVYKESNRKFPESALLNGNMCWSLYHVHIKSFDYEHGNLNQFIKQVDYILEHCGDSPYSPKARVASLAADAVFRKKLSANIDYELGNKYLSCIDPGQLSLEEKEVTVDERTIKTASDREKWYTNKVKALLGMKKYEECIEYIDRSFIEIDKFHNNGHQWMKYREALCCLELGKYDAAEIFVNQALKTLKHWSLYELLYRVAAAKEDQENAVKYGALCAAADREHKMRVNFYVDFADYLAKAGKPYEAALHYKLVEEIRNEEGWKGFRLPDGFTYPENVASLDKKGVIRELVRFWNEEINRGVEFHEGVIDKILPGERSGFIQDNDGSSYYFSIRDFVKRIDSITEGAKVKYQLEDRLDKKKNIVKPNAVKISYVK